MDLILNVINVIGLARRVDIVPHIVLPVRVRYLEWTYLWLVMNVHV